NTVYISGQIPLDPATMAVVEGGINAQIRRVFDNVKAVCEAAGGDLSQVVKLTVYLTDLANFPAVNDIMAEYIEQPYPARAAVGISALPKGVDVEIEGILVLDA
ncbi:MAG: Rid family detoxifying hydrolase, partial [Pseudomonadota bacterium]